MLADENIFQEDLPGNKRQKRSKEHDVQLGYASDSDDNHLVDLDDSDEEDKSDKEDPDKEASDDDMFASDKEEDDKKKNEFDLDRFEQEQGLGKYDEEPELNTKHSEDPTEAANEDELQDYYNNIEDFDEDTTRSRPKQELQMEAFNLREEAENGEFDKNMNYVQKQPSDDEQDEAWMAHIRAKDIENARRAQLRQDQAASRTREHVATEKLLSDMIAILEPAETPLEALARLRPKKTRRKIKNTNLVATLEETERKTIVFALTESCERLLNDKGISQIYETTREELMRAFKRETGLDFQDRGVKRSREEPEEDTPSEVLWEYHWLDGEDEEWHGPHTAYEMSYWKDNYFENNVEVRAVGTGVTQHISQTDFGGS